MVNAQEWLDKNYPKEERKNIKELDISNNKLGISLNLGDFINLEILKCNDNQLTSLDILNCSKLRILVCSSNWFLNLNLTGLNQLEIVYCNNNYLTNFDYSVLNPKRLIYFNIAGNYLPEQNISIFKHFVNLEILLIGGSEKHNLFYGSLESLKNLNKLRKLHIINTDIDSGLEFLPENVEEIYCSSKERPESKVKRIERLLTEDKNFSFDDKLESSSGISGYKRNWKRIHRDFDKKLENLWIEKGFDANQTKEWVKVGLDPRNIFLAAHLKENSYTPQMYASFTSKNAQKWLNYFYPQTKRKEVKVLDATNQNLEGFLDLSDFVNLEILLCEKNKIVGLEINECSRLEVVRLSNNKLTDLNFLSKINPKKLTYLDLSNNNFPAQDLSVFSSLVNLETLSLWGNPFLGSLEPLSKLGELKNLSVSETKIDCGLEKLPKSLEKIFCRDCQVLESQLQGYKKSDENEFAYYDYPTWKKESKLNVQQWIDENYPNKQSVEVIDLTRLRNIVQESELTVENYSNLREIRKEKRSNISKITKVTVANCPNLEKIDISYLWNNRKLILNNLPSLKMLDCQDNKISILDLSAHSNLTNLECWGNQLTDLKISNNSQLGKIECQGLTNLDFLANLNSKKLTSFCNFILGVNDSPNRDLSCFSRFINLETLQINSNRFHGSLEPLKNLTKLRNLQINDTDIDSGLEFLPDSVRDFRCEVSSKRPHSRVNKLYQELFLYGWRIENWREAHSELMGEKKVGNFYRNKEVIKIVTTPELFSKEENKIEENCKLDEVYYQEIPLRDNRPFSWEEKEKKLSTLGELPVKLYNIKEDKVEWTKENSSIGDYATLSYAWGESRKTDSIDNWSSKYKEKLSLLGYKSLYKAIQTCKLLGINYLWMDQLCIDQNSVEEKNQEVPKMKQYYGNSKVTLASVNDKCKNENIDKENKKELVIRTLEKIVNSQWFSRSWTFQEGLLSKQIIFMFDDLLVDGRLMAQVWALLQQPSNHFWKLNEEPQVFVTPVGWTYCKNENSLKDKVNLGLIQSLTAIKYRNRQVPIDGIYSILGLLPYGDKVVPKYKEWKHKYTKRELEEALLDMMRLAVREGDRSEPLVWIGLRRNEPYLWWIPEMDEKGSTSAWTEFDVSCDPQSIELEENGFKLLGFKYVIGDLGNYNEGTNEIEVRGEKIDDSFRLQGDEKTLKKVKLWDILIISEEQWANNKPLAILVSGKNNSDYSVSIVKLTNWTVMRLGKDWRVHREEKGLFVDVVNKKVIELERREVAKLEVAKLVRERERSEKYHSSFKEEEIMTAEEALKILQGIPDWKWKQSEQQQDLQQFAINWNTIHPSFTPKLVQSWQNLNFTYPQTQDWINIGLQPNDYNFCAWLSDIKQLTPEEVLNHSNLQQLNQEFFAWWQEQQSQIQIPPK